MKPSICNNTPFDMMRLLLRILIISACAVLTHAYQLSHVDISQRSQQRMILCDSSLFEHNGSTVFNRRKSRHSTRDGTDVLEHKRFSLPLKNDVNFVSSSILLETASLSPSPRVQRNTDDRMEYRMNLGRAMDTLRRDMADILVKKPEFSIYHDQIQAIDPSGVQTTGLQSYKSAIAFLQTFIQFWFQPKYSSVQFRMIYDVARSSIRISWNMKLAPKFPLVWRPLHVDGISHYTLEASSGKIIEHKIENLLINNTPVAPPYGILNILQQDFLRMRQIPSPQAVPGGYC